MFYLMKSGARGFEHSRVTSTNQDGARTASFIEWFTENGIRPTSSTSGECLYKRDQRVRTFFTYASFGSLNATIVSYRPSS